MNTAMKTQVTIQGNEAFTVVSNTDLGTARAMLRGLGVDMRSESVMGTHAKVTVASSNSRSLKAVIDFLED